VYVDSLGSALHATTGADGFYSIPNVPPGTHQVYVQSPTQDPATAFRYINLFRGWVDLAAYEMNGVRVPAQHLPDTGIQGIAYPLRVNVTGLTRLDVALMQGFLTLPFGSSQTPDPLAWNLSDVLNYTVSCDRPVPRDEISLSYDGKYSKIGDPFATPPSGRSGRLSQWDRLSGSRRKYGSPQHAYLYTLGHHSACRWRTAHVLQLRESLRAREAVQQHVCPPRSRPSRSKLEGLQRSGHRSVGRQWHQ
jgi:hypothetical protein